MKAYSIFGAFLALSACGQATKSVADATESAPVVPVATGGKATAAPSQNPDMTEFAQQVDTDGDGRMSRAEWRAKGLPETSFNGFEKRRGYVTLDDYRNNPAPEGIDLNGDGKLTIEEFKEFDRMMASRMGAPR